MTAPHDTEQLIRDALARQAERAPHPQRVLAGLHQGRTPRRGSFRLLAAFAAVAIVAVGVPLSLRLLAPVNQQAPLPPAAPAAPPERPGTPLRFGPGWLPEGLVETERGHANDQGVYRTWTPGHNGGIQDGNEPYAQLSVYPATAPAWADVPRVLASGKNGVPVGGTRGYVAADRAEDQFARLVWMPGADTVLVLNVGNLPKPLALARRIADSVRPVEAPEVRMPVIGDGLRDLGFSVRGASPDGWTAVAQGRRGKYLVSVELSRAEFRPGGQPVTVRGRSGSYLERPDGSLPGSRIAVPLGNGLLLSVYGTDADGLMPLPDLIAVTDALTVDEQAGYPWLGTR
ncbi:hypothetical protein [Amycolatopsis anabasis]|uniref:hypothetical protein n=1 Tax=Amycolatopsis anabasis TaxID=1840409 RepID=UPI00131BEE27|nr:hypothetical protein [Amycolatopsis anabasis]